MKLNGLLNLKRIDKTKSTPINSGYFGMFFDITENVLYIKNSDDVQSAYGFNQVTQNTIIVDPNLPEVLGKNYKTWADANSYILTQTPSAINLWTIKITGINSEDIVLTPYINISGELNNTTLLGKITSIATSQTCSIMNCVITNIESLLDNNFLFHNCIINLTTQNIIDGKFEIYYSNILNGQFDNLTSFDHCIFPASSLAEVRGCKIYNSTIFSQIFKSPTKSATYIIKNCVFNEDIDLTFDFLTYFEVYNSSFMGVIDIENNVENSRIKLKNNSIISFQVFGTFPCVFTDDIYVNQRQIDHLILTPTLIDNCFDNPSTIIWDYNISNVANNKHSSGTIFAVANADSVQILDNRIVSIGSTSDLIFSATKPYTVLSLFAISTTDDYIIKLNRRYL